MKRTPWINIRVRAVPWQELPGALSCRSPEQCMKRINIRVRAVPWQELPGALSCRSCQVSECEEDLILGSV